MKLHSKIRINLSVIPIFFLIFFSALIVITIVFYPSFTIFDDIDVFEFAKGKTLLAHFLTYMKFDRFYPMAGTDIWLLVKLFGPNFQALYTYSFALSIILLFLLWKSSSQNSSSLILILILILNPSFVEVFYRLFSQEKIFAIASLILFLLLQKFSGSFFKVFAISIISLYLLFLKELGFLLIFPVFWWGMITTTKRGKLLSLLTILFGLTWIYCFFQFVSLNNIFAYSNVQKAAQDHFLIHMGKVIIFQIIELPFNFLCILFSLEILTKKRCGFKKYTLEEIFCVSGLLYFLTIVFLKLISFRYSFPAMILTMPYILMNSRVLVEKISTFPKTLKLLLTVLIISSIISTVNSAIEHKLVAKNTQEFFLDNQKLLTEKPLYLVNNYYGFDEIRNSLHYYIREFSGIAPEKILTKGNNEIEFLNNPTNYLTIYTPFSAQETCTLNSDFTLLYESKYSFNPLPNIRWLGAKIFSKKYFCKDSKYKIYLFNSSKKDSSS